MRKTLCITAITETKAKQLGIA